MSGINRRRSPVGTDFGEGPATAFSKGSRALLMAGALLLTPGVFGIGLGHAQVLGADPIYDAIEDRDAEALNREILGGAFVSGQDSSGRTPLIAAVQTGMPNLVDLLLRAGASVNEIDSTGNTALAWAAKEGNTTILESLLDVGADVDTQNQQGMSPLMLAAREGQLATAQQLLSAGANPDLLDYTGRGAVDWAREGRNSRLTRLLGG